MGVFSQSWCKWGRQHLQVPQLAQICTKNSHSCIPRIFSPHLYWVCNLISYPFFRIQSLFQWHAQEVKNAMNRYFGVKYVRHFKTVYVTKSPFICVLFRCPYCAALTVLYAAWVLYIAQTGLVSRLRRPYTCTLCIICIMSRSRSLLISGVLSVSLGYPLPLKEMTFSSYLLANCCCVYLVQKKGSLWSTI